MTQPKDPKYAPRPVRRLVLPEKQLQAELKINPNNVTADQVLRDALLVICTDIARYRNKVTVKGESLELSESRILQGHIKALTEIKREQREADRADDLSKLSEHELYALAKQALATLPEMQDATVVKDPEDDES